MFELEEQYTGACNQVTGESDRSEDSRGNTAHESNASMASESGVRRGERKMLHDGLCLKQVLKMLAGAN